MIIGNRIKEERLKLNISQEDLGNLIGVSKVSVSGYEKGIRTPSLETFLQLIEVFKVSADFLLGRDFWIVNETEVSYNKFMTKEEVKIIDELRKRPELYKIISARPKSTLDVMNKRIK